MFAKIAFSDFFPALLTGRSYAISSDNDTHMASTKGKKRVVFEVEASPSSTVLVAGSFNSWQPAELKPKAKTRGAGQFSRIFYLPHGRYEYKYLIDGEWSVDSKCRDWSPNEFGTLNSVMNVG